MARAVHLELGQVDARLGLHHCVYAAASFTPSSWFRSLNTLTCENLVTLVSSTNFG